MLREPISQRVAGRYRMQLPVDFLLESGGRLRVFTRDVSASGLFVLVNRNLRLCDRLRFLFTFPFEITTSCRILTLCDGVVVRREITEGAEGLAIKIERYVFLSSAP